MTHGIIRTTMFTAIVGSCFLTASADAGTLIPASDVGWYNQQGDHIAIAKGFMTGYAGAWDGQSYRSYYTFKLPTNLLPIASASLQIYSEAGGYDSPNASEKFALFDVSTTTTVLKWGQTGSKSIYNDLGTGDVYGSAIVTASSVGWVNIPLSAAGLLALNASAGREFALGGSIPVLNKLGTYLNQLIFTAGYDVSQVRLNVNYASPLSLLGGGEVAAASVPEPSSLIGASLAVGLALAARKFRGARRAG